MKPIITLISTLIISFAGSAIAVTENDLRYEVGGDLEKGLLTACDADGNSTISGKEVLCKIQYKTNNNKKEGAEARKEGAEARKEGAEWDKRNAEALIKGAEYDKKIAATEKEMAKTRESIAKKEQVIEEIKKDIREKIEQ